MPKIRKEWILFCVMAFVLLVNYMTETFSVNWRNNSDSSELKVLCYNVHSLDSSFGHNQLGIADRIIKENPDIVFLCEYYPSRSKKLDSILTKEYRRYYKTRTFGVFYSKYEMDSIAEVFPAWYKKSSSQSVRVHVFRGKDTLTIIGCHLSSSHHRILEGYKRRKKEADTLYEHIRNDRYPVIVMGDLNDVPGSYTLYKIKKAGLFNAWWEGGCGYGVTFHDGLLRLRLDHILYPKDKLKLQNIKVLDSNLSDHNALVANFSFR